MIAALLTASAAGGTAGATADAVHGRRPALRSVVALAVAEVAAATIGLLTAPTALQITSHLNHQ